MRPDFVSLVRATWRLVAPNGVPIGLLFYARLFELDPSLRALFPEDLTPHAKKLAQAMSYAVASLDRLDSIAPALEMLGRRHVGYGVRDHDYDTVGRALLDTLALTFGDGFTAEARAAWADTYAALSGVMRRAGAEAEAERRDAVARAAALQGPLSLYRSIPLVA